VNWFNNTNNNIYSAKPYARVNSVPLSESQTVSRWLPGSNVTLESDCTLLQSEHSPVTCCYSSIRLIVIYLSQGVDG